MKDVMRKVGSPRFGKHYPPRDQVIELRGYGYSLPQIAEYFGVSRSTIKRRLDGE